MGEFPPPLPGNRPERLLRGPLILTAISRVMMIPFYFICAVGSARDLGKFYHHVADYRVGYVVDLVVLTVTMWTFLLFSLVLAVLFFSRQRAFRPMMIYFSLLLPLLFVGVGIHIAHFAPPHRTRTHNNPSDAWLGFSMVLAVIVWPFYYWFSPRVKRVFTR